jgi:protein-tyrosine phosphatase
MASEQRLNWEGCFNVRDLGGIPTKQGQVVREGAVVRSDSLDALSESGWDAIEPV